jgi:hypothetical protein
VNLHYGSGDAILAIDTALRKAGKDPTTLGVADLEPVDQFHLGRAEATRDLARLAKLQPGQKVLDIGGGSVARPANWRVSLAVRFRSSI